MKRQRNIGYHRTENFTEASSAATTPAPSKNDEQDEENNDEPIDVTAAKQAEKERLTEKIRKDYQRRKASIYAFFESEPAIEYMKNDIKPEYLVFTCRQCAIKIRQGVQTGDKGSTGQ
ncbi:hypothetical protein EV360DRAFT_76272 [Lentinula raphanica]|nr:hypothetical protein EV360DRAFT_76272 [Lentinula raphanica]